VQGRANVRNFFFANLPHIEDENSEQNAASKSDRRFFLDNQYLPAIVCLSFFDPAPCFKPTMIVLSLPAFFKKITAFEHESRPFQDL